MSNITIQKILEMSDEHYEKTGKDAKVLVLTVEQLEALREETKCICATDYVVSAEQKAKSPEGADGQVGGVFIFTDNVLAMKYMRTHYEQEIFYKEEEQNGNTK